MIIGISGKMGSGKDTLANFIKSADTSYKIRNFADTLKTITSIILDIDHNLCYTREGKNSYPYSKSKYTIGEHLQIIGNLLRKNIDENIWNLTTIDKIPSTSKFIFPDLRHLNEIKAIKDKKGIVIRIHRNNIDFNNRDISHISETELDTFSNWDYEFHNNGTLYELSMFAETILRKLNNDNL